MNVYTEAINVEYGHSGYPIKMNSTSFYVSAIRLNIGLELNKIDKAYIHVNAQLSL